MQNIIDNYATLFDDFKWYKTDPKFAGILKTIQKY